MYLGTHDPDASSWWHLATRLQKGFREVVPEWRYHPNLDVPKEQAQDEWFAWSASRDANIQPLVSEWISGGKIDADDSELRYLFAARLLVAYQLVGQMAFLSRLQKTSVAPFPPASEDELARFLLIDWWNSVGQSRAFYATYQGEMTIS
jgi:hypothetical protein